LAAALADLRIEGVHTTASLHAALVNVPDVRNGCVDTSWLERWMLDNANLLHSV
jgi:acetyl-CoA carboxylase, biotin carboxylase subunit